MVKENCKCLIIKHLQSLFFQINFTINVRNLSIIKEIKHINNFIGNNCLPKCRKVNAIGGVEIATWKTWINFYAIA